jgi:FAD/FMN-containing dehydrogenase
VAVAIESRRHTAPFGDGYPYYLLIESCSDDAERGEAVFLEFMEGLLERGLAADAVIAQSDSQSDALWAIREDIEGLFGVLPHLKGFDISLPLAAMERYVDELCGAVSHRWGQRGRVAVFGHLGDGNLHIAVTTGGLDPGEAAQVAELVYTPLARCGGSVSAEHGIGLEKRDYLSLSRTVPEIALMRSIKTMLDPKGILNPGKLFLSP